MTQRSKAFVEKCSIGVAAFFSLHKMDSFAYIKPCDFDLRVSLAFSAFERLNERYRYVVFCFVCVFSVPGGHKFRSGWIRFMRRAIVPQLKTKFNLNVSLSLSMPFIFYFQRNCMTLPFQTDRRAVWCRRRRQRDGWYLRCHGSQLTNKWPMLCWSTLKQINFPKNNPEILCTNELGFVFIMNFRRHKWKRKQIRTTKKYERKLCN